MKTPVLQVVLAILLLSVCSSAQGLYGTTITDQQNPRDSRTAFESPQPARFLSPDFIRLKGSPPRLPSAQSTFAVIDTAVITSTAGTTRHLYSFNALGLRISDLKQKLEGQNWENSSRVSEAYDAMGRLVSLLTETWSGDLWTNSVREAFTYDANGNQTESLSEQWSGGRWVLAQRQTTSYNVNGQWTSHIVERWVGEQLAVKETAECRYDAAGHPAEYNCREWQNGKETYSARGEETYDAYNNLLSRWYVRRAGGIEESWRETYAYDSAGNRLSAVNERGLYGQLENSTRETYTFDTQGHMLARLDENWSGNHWMPEDRYSYSYDDAGHLVYETWEQFSEGGWPYLYSHTYTHDGSGNTLTDLYEGWSFGRKMVAVLWRSTYDDSGRKLSASYGGLWNGSVVDSRDSSFAYDVDGRMITRRYEERSAGQLLIGDICDQTFDLKGRLTSTKYRRWLNSSWMPADSDRWGWTLGVQLSDGAGNAYDFSGHSIALSYREITTGVESDGENQPLAFGLSQNYPNPFNPTTTISYAVGVESNRQSAITGVKVAVYDMLGREVAVLFDGPKAPGSYTATWDATGAASGVYVCRVVAGDFVATRKMILLR